MYFLVHGILSERGETRADFTRPLFARGNSLFLAHGSSDTQPRRSTSRLKSIQPVNGANTETSLLWTLVPPPPPPPLLSRAIGYSRCGRPTDFHHADEKQKDSERKKRGKTLDSCVSRRKNEKNSPIRCEANNRLGVSRSCGDLLSCGRFSGTMHSTKTCFSHDNGQGTLLYRDIKSVYRNS